MKTTYILILLLLLSGNIFSQNKTDYYYYKGEKVSLYVNTNTIAISFYDKNTINSINKLKSPFSKVSEYVEDFTPSKLKTINRQTTNKKEPVYYTEIEFNTNLSLKEYYKQIELYKNLPNVITSMPTFKTKDNDNAFGISNYFYVKLKRKEDYSILNDLAAKMNAEILGYNEYMPLWYTLSSKASKKHNAIYLANLFYETGYFAGTEPGFILKNLINTNDTYFNTQWALNNTGQANGTQGIDINAEPAWQLSTGEGVNVAVIDQGIEMNHPDLQSNISNISFDAQTNTVPSVVRGNHATPCAGIIAAVQDNSLGVSGIAPDAELTSISVNFNFATTPQMLANGINWAWRNNADIISNSWGGGSRSGFIDDAINNALNRGRGGLGCVVVFSSGNFNINGAEYPSNSNPRILCVGAIDRCGIRSGRIDIIPQSCDPWPINSRPGSSFGLPLDVVAPGTNVLSTDRQGSAGDNGFSNLNYTWFGGTSAACPYVAGIAALIISINPDLTVDEINTIIEQSAQKITTNLYSYNNFNNRPNGSWNNQLGYGLIDAYAATLLAKQTACIDNLNLTQTIHTNQTITELVSNTITSTSIINSGANVQYSAGNKVILKPGFKATAGATFRAYIEGCQSSNSSARIANNSDYSTYNKEINTNTDLNNPISVYPNPTNGDVNISSKTQIQAYVLTNHFGRTLYSKNLTATKTKTTFNINNVPTGIYFLKIKLANGETQVKRIIKE